MKNSEVIENKTKEVQQPAQTKPKEVQPPTANPPKKDSLPTIGGVTLTLEQMNIPKK